MKCPCPPWFPENTVQGTYNWDVFFPPSCSDTDTRPREYKTTIEYTCPSGHAFDTAGMDVQPNETSVLEWTCEKWNQWSPDIEPKCIREEGGIDHRSKSSSFLEREKNRKYRTSKHER